MLRILFLVIFSLGIFSQSQAQDSKEYIIRNEDNNFYVKLTLSEAEFNIYKCKNLVNECTAVGGAQPVTAQQAAEVYHWMQNTLNRPTDYATVGALGGLACAALRVCPQAGTKIFISIAGGAAIGYGVGLIPQSSMDRFIREIDAMMPLMQKVSDTISESERTGINDVYVDYNLEDVVVLYSSLKLFAHNKP